MSIIIPFYLYLARHIVSVFTAVTILARAGGVGWAWAAGTGPGWTVRPGLDSSGEVGNPEQSYTESQQEWSEDITPRTLA